MSAKKQRLGLASNIAAATRTRIYTVPAGKVAILSTVTQGSDNGPQNMGLTINGFGWLWQPNITGTFANRVWPMSTVLNAGEYIEVEHSAAGGYTAVFGVELDARDAPQAYRTSFFNLTSTAQNLVIPAGKRLRIREVVICPHGGSGTANIYISGIGYLVRSRLAANEPEVHRTDMLAFAGETLGASGSGTTLHAFISGEMLDA